MAGATGVATAGAVIVVEPVEPRVVTVWVPEVAKVAGMVAVEVLLVT